ncbi:uncharacterized protein ACWYII_004668, partial [Salvelinus alpinus]
LSDIIDQTPQSLAPAQHSGPSSSITSQPAPPPSSIMAQPAHPPSSIMAQPAHPPSSIMAQPAHPPSSIMAQGGSVVVAPQLVGCIVAGSVHHNINIIMPSHGADEELPKVKDKHKSNMKKKFGSIFEGLGKRGNPTLLDKIYTELYITAGESEGVNKEHEVRQIEDTARTKAFQDDAINCNDIFRSLDPKTEEHNDKSQSKQEVPIRTVLTNGIAGIGKTVSVQKFILDWAEGIANQDVDFVFALPFRDLNLIKDACNLLKLLSDFHPDLTDMKDAKKVVDGKVVFIFDGLDESQLPLCFHNNKRLSNVTETTSVDVLLTNLIKGNLLPSALLWITSRPAAVDKIPSDCFDRVTEVRGFNDPQKEEYFKKRFSDNENLASKIISHIKTSRSLHIMCHIPVFCWITAKVFGEMLSENDHGKVPLTEMYIRFLLTLTNMKNKKYHGENEPDPRNLSEPDVQIILKLGKLAFQNLEKSNRVFSEDYLREFGIDVNEAFLLSGMCTEIFREEDPMFQAKMYSFVHLTIQEFFAALYVASSYASENVNPFRLRDYQELPRKNDSVSGDTYFGDRDDDCRDDDGRDDDGRDDDGRDDDGRDDDCWDDDCRDDDGRDDDGRDDDGRDDGYSDDDGRDDGYSDDDCRDDDGRDDDGRDDDGRVDDYWDDDCRDDDCRDDGYSDDDCRDDDGRDDDGRDDDCRDDDGRDDDFREDDFREDDGRDDDYREDDCRDDDGRDDDGRDDDGRDDDCRDDDCRDDDCRDDGYSDDDCRDDDGRDDDGRDDDYWDDDGRDDDCRDDGYGDDDGRDDDFREDDCRDDDGRDDDGRDDDYREDDCRDDDGRDDDGRDDDGRDDDCRDDDYWEDDCRDDDGRDDDCRDDDYWEDDCRDDDGRDDDCRDDDYWEDDCRDDDGRDDDGRENDCKDDGDSDEGYRDDSWSEDEDYRPQHRGSQQLQKTLHDLQRSAVDESLNSETGHLDLFLRFLLGISLETNQILLKSLKLQTEGDAESIQKTIQYIKDRLSDKKQRQYPSPERCINLFHCLIELNDTLFVNIILKLGKVAFQNLEKSNLVFSEDDLIGCGIDVKEAFLLSGMCTEIFREEDPMFRTKTYSCVHLPVQEFFAALYVSCVYAEECCGRSVEERDRSPRPLPLFSSGHLTGDQSDPLEKLQTEGDTESIQKTIQYIKDKLSPGNHGNQVFVVFLKQYSSVQCFNLLLCLMELNNNSPVEEIQSRTERKLTPGQCSALAYMLLMSEEVLGEFDMRKYSTTLEGGRRLVPVGRHCRKAMEVQEDCYDTLGSSLTSEKSHLTELDLSYNKLTNTGVERISTGLMSPQCKLKILILVRCEVTSCGSLSLALAASQLEELHLSCNTLGDMGQKRLSAGLEDPHCQIQKLGLRQCNLSELSCESLASVLCSNSTLKELDLRDNNLGDSGVELLSAELGDPRCASQVLGLSGCLVTEEGCASLASALGSNPSHLRELDLSFNHPGDSGVKLLSDRLEDPHCRLEKLM